MKGKEGRKEGRKGKERKEGPRLLFLVGKEGRKGRERNFFPPPFHRKEGRKEGSKEGSKEGRK